MIVIKVKVKVIKGDKGHRGHGHSVTVVKFTEVNTNVIMR